MLDWLNRPPYPFVRSVICTTKSDRAFRGILWKRANGFLVLKNAELLQPRGAAAAMAGEVVIAEREVDFLQVLSEASG